MIDYFVVVSLPSQGKAFYVAPTGNRTPILSREFDYFVVGEGLWLFAAAEGICLQIMACSSRLESITDYFTDRRGRRSLRIITYQYYSRKFDYLVIGR